MDFEDLLEKAENSLVLQEQNPELATSPYLQGVVNGMAFVLAILRDEAPTPPADFLKDF